MVVQGSTLVIAPTEKVRVPKPHLPQVQIILYKPHLLFFT